MIRFIILTLMLMLPTITMAQEYTPPDSWMDVFNSPSSLIAGSGFLLGIINHWLTAAGKHTLKTSGSQTIVLSAILPVVMAVAASIWGIGAFAEMNIVQAAITAFWAFVQSNGAALSQRQAMASAIRRADAGG